MRHCFLFALAASLGAAVSFNHHQFFSSVKPSATVSVPEIKTPKNDRRSFLLLNHSSGLQSLLVNDPDAKKAAFSVAVAAGSVDDPEDVPGLAHFLEHMLFLGSDKYPDPEEYRKVMNKYDGVNNAYTDADVTVFFGELAEEGLTPALDVFAQFFIAPSLNETMTGKEVNAVNSEHEKNVPDMTRRMWQLLRGEVANPDSPLSHFFTGNRETLWAGPKKEGIHVVDRLRAFHDKHYCPPNMRLVVISNQELGVLEEAVMGSFDGITVDQEKCHVTRILPPVSHLQAPDITRGEACPELSGQNVQDRPFPDAFPHDRLGFKYFTESLTNPQLWLMFPIPLTVDLDRLYKFGVETYLSEAIGSAGPKSLKASLMKQDLVTDLGTWWTGSKAGAQVFVIFDLTERGEEEYESVLEQFFGFANLLKGEGVHAELYSDLSKLGEAKFAWQERPSSDMDAASGMARALTVYDVEDVIRGGGVIQETSPCPIERVLEAFRADNMVYALASQKKNLTEHHEANSGQTQRHSERWYGIDYLKANISKDLLEAFDSAISPAGVESLKSIEFVPDADFPVLSPQREEKEGELRAPDFLDAENVYYVGVPHHLQVPKAEVTFRVQPVTRREGASKSSQKGHALLPTNAKGAVYSPSVSLSDTVMMQLHGYVVTALLEPQVYKFQLCGLRYGFGVGPHSGLQLSFSGFSQHLEKLVKLVLPVVLDPFSPDANEAERVFKQSVYKMRLSLGNDADLMAIQHAFEMRAVVTETASFTRSEMLSFLEDTGIADLIHIFGEYLGREWAGKSEDPYRKLLITSLFVGNVGAEEAKHLSQVVSLAVAKHAGGASFVAGAEGDCSGKSVLLVNASQRHLFQPSVQQQVLRLGGNKGKPGALQIRARNPVPNDVSDVVLQTMQLGVPGIEDRVRLQILRSVVEATTFAYLRTQKQLGYVVQGDVRLHVNVGEVSAAVQGTAEDPDAVEAAVAENWAQVRTAIQHISPEELQARKGALRATLSARSVNLAAHSAEYWRHIDEGEQCFNLRALMLASLNSTSDTGSLLRLWDGFFKGPALTIKLFGVNSDAKLHPSNETALPSAEKRASLIEEDGVYPVGLRCAAKPPA